MIKDIPNKKVQDVGIAIVPEKNDIGETEWTVYLVNFKKNKISNVLVSSKGYGESDGEKLETSQLRHFLDDVSAESATKIEPIMEDVFKLSNQYWVSFYDDGHIFDRKYIFVPDSIVESNLVMIPVIERKGILIR